IYHHPLIRYDVSTGDAVIAGLAEGAMLLRCLPSFDEFALGGALHRVLECRIETRRVEIGSTQMPIAYDVRTPYLALNQENHQAWVRSASADRRALLARVVVGNLLSLS